MARGGQGGGVEGRGNLGRMIQVETLGQEMVPIYHMEGYLKG